MASLDVAVSPDAAISSPVLLIDFAPEPGRGGPCAKACRNYVLPGEGCAMTSPKKCFKGVSGSQSFGRDVDITGVDRVPQEKTTPSPAEQAQLTTQNSFRFADTKQTAFELKTKDFESDDDECKTSAHSVISDGWEELKMDTFTFATSTQVPLPIRVKMYGQGSS